MRFDLIQSNRKISGWQPRIRSPVLRRLRLHRNAVAVSPFPYRPISSTDSTSSVKTSVSFCILPHILSYNCCGGKIPGCSYDIVSSFVNRERLCRRHASAHARMAQFLDFTRTFIPGIKKENRAPLPIVPQWTVCAAARMAVRLW
jgi:hypothetical protein